MTPTAKVTGSAETDRDRSAALVEELRHRVRGMLATTRLIVRRSAETSESLDDYVAHLDGRLAALGRVQNVAIRNPQAGIDLGLLVADELTSEGMAGFDRIQIEGETVLLHPRAAEHFALGLHELMTNAIKYGALSVPEGRLAISWRVKADGDGPLLFDLEWTETRVPLVENPSRHRGFGTIVLEEMLPYNLDATVKLVFAPDGLMCRIALPLTERVVGLPA